VNAGASIFTKLMAGEIPCQCVFENEHVFAFLDINPLATGHTLLIPRRAAPRIADLTPEESAELGRQLPMLVRKVTTVTGAAGCNVLLNDGTVAGQEVPHVHFHIVPRTAGDGLGYRWKPEKADPAALAELAEEIRAAE
jgi:histidine triad (HIT) family protein